MCYIYCFHGCGQDIDIFKSLLSSLQKNLKEHTWIFLKGNYSKDEGGWGWYNYNENSIFSVQKLINIIKNPSESVLIGFSEGAQMVLDISQYIPELKGVVALSPSYGDKPIQMIKCHVILITSNNDDKIMKKYKKQWKKYIDFCTSFEHNKGHKIYLPLEYRQAIKKYFKL